MVDTCHKLERMKKKQPKLKSILMGKKSKLLEFHPWMPFPSQALPLHFDALFLAIISIMFLCHPF